MTTRQVFSLVSLTLLAALALPASAEDRGRGAPRQLEKEEQAANERARRDESDRAPREQPAERERPADRGRQPNAPDERRQPAPSGNQPQPGTDRSKDSRYDPYGGYPPYGGGTYGGGTYGGTYGARLVAEATVRHEDPSRLNAEIGVVGEPFRPISVRFREDSYEIIRQQQNDPGRARPRSDSNRTATVEVELNQYAQWMTGQREWFLRIEDRSRTGGQLLNFTIRTDRGTYRVRNVPATIGAGRRLEARVTPLAGGTSGGYYPNGGGYYPNGGGYYPNGGGYYPAPAYQNTVVRSMPRQGYAGQRITLQYQLRTGSVGVNRLEITEVLPPTGWQIVGASPQPRQIDQRGARVTWDIVGARDGMVLSLQVVVPRVDGGQRFKGTYRFDGGPQRSIDGEQDIYLGDSYYNNYPYGTGNNYPYGTGYNYPYSNASSGLDELLGVILGLPFRSDR